MTRDGIGEQSTVAGETEKSLTDPQSPVTKHSAGSGSAQADIRGEAAGQPGTPETPETPGVPGDLGQTGNLDQTPDFVDQASIQDNVLSPDDGGSETTGSADFAEESRTFNPTGEPGAKKGTGQTPRVEHQEEEPDHWLDPITTENQTRRGVLNAIIQETFGQPFFFIRRLWGFLTTSPGKITVMTVIISVAIFAAGYAMSVSSDTRQAHLDELITNTEPVSYNAHVLYTSLSIADTTATTGFVQAGIEGPINRVRYNTAIDRASIAATDTAASADTSNERLMELVTEIQRYLPIYTGLVETARSNNRAGNPVSVAYMAEASSMMRNDILPMAAELYNMTSRAVSDQQMNMMRPQWVPLSGLLAALGMLLVAQWWLMRITRRRVNKGFALATVLMLVATIWVAAADWTTWQAGTKGFEEASGPLKSMTTARIYAQQTRTTETLSLVRRQSVQGSTTGFNATISQLKRSINEYEQSSHADTPEHQELIRQVRNSMDTWSHEHDQFTVFLRNGDYSVAVATALGTDDEGLSSFESLDLALAELISDSRTSMRSYIESGLAATSLVAISVLILSVASVVALWIGIRPRLQEYL